MSLMNLTAVELGKKIKAGEVKVKDAVLDAFAQIETVENDINSYVTVIDKEEVLKKAEEIQAKVSILPKLCVDPVMIIQPVIHIQEMPQIKIKLQHQLPLRKFLFLFQKRVEFSHDSEKIGNQQIRIRQYPVLCWFPL